MFVSATKEDSTCLDVYRLDFASGDLHRVTARRGMYNNVAIAKGGRTLLANFTAFGSLRELVSFSLRVRDSCAGSLGVRVRRGLLFVGRLRAGHRCAPPECRLEASATSAVQVSLRLSPNPHISQSGFADW